MKNSFIVAPSILAANFACLGQEARHVLEAGADWIHVDVMDGHFVPNISFGPEMVRMLKQEVPHIPLDVHLMIEHCDRYLETFLEAGAHHITVHVEEKSKHDVASSLALIRAYGRKAGLALNPKTALNQAICYLDSIDILLCMTVEPGFGGQAFMVEMLDKIRAARAYASEHQLHFDIEVDGGINPQTASLCAEAGANVFVAGTSIFKAPNMKEAINSLKKV